MVYGEPEPTGLAYLRLAVDEDLFYAMAAPCVYFEIGAFMRAIIFTLEVFTLSLSLNCGI